MLKKIIKGKNILMLFMACLSGIPIIWFLTNGGALINGLDTNFPLNPIVWFTRRLYIWNGTVNGGVNFGSSVSGLFFHFLQVLPFYFKLSLLHTEIFTLVFWFTSIVISAYFFAKNIISRKLLVQAIFVCLYCLNIYMFNTWENVKVSNLALVIGLPLVIVLINKTTKKEINYVKSALLSTIVGVLISGSGINPAYFLTIILGALLFVIAEIIGNHKNVFQILLSAVLVISIIFFVNLFWIIPLIFFLFLNSRVDSLSAIGFTDWLGSLSENTSIMNVLRLQGAWDWYVKDGVGIPLYIPYAVKYFSNPFFIAFSFITPSIAMFSLFYKRNEKHIYYLFFTILVLLGVFFGAGSHAPTGVAFVFLSKHVPFFSFFRSPWYIFTPLTILGLTSLVGFFADYLLEKKLRRESLWGVKTRLIIPTFLCMYILGNVIYSYPLLTGKIYRPGRSDSFYVNFPDYVYKTRDWLASSKLDRILTYPDDQLESFNWGYKGTESILSLFSDKEVVTPAFNVSNQSYSLLQQSLYNHLKRGEYESAFAEARMFSVDSLFTKTDVDTLSHNINKSIGAYTKELFSSGPWSIHKLNDEYISPKIYIASNIYLAKRPQEVISFVSKSLTKGDVIIDENDSAVPAFKNMNLNHILEATQDRKDSNSYSINLSDDSIYSLIFDNYSKGPITVILDGKKTNPQEIVFHDSYIQISNISLNKGIHTIQIQNEENIDLFTSSDLVNYKKTFPFGKEGQRINMQIVNFDPKSKYELSFDYRYSYGYLPILKLTQYNGTTQYRISRIGVIDSHEWTTSTEIISPVLVNSEFALTLETDPKYERPSLTEFRNFSFSKINPTRIFLIEKADKKPIIPVTFTKGDPTNYSLNVDSSFDLNSHILVFNDNYDPGWEIAGGNVGNSPVHFAVNGFSNAWYIPKSDIPQKFTISYKPQKYYMFSFIFPISTIILIIACSLILRKKQ